MEPSSNIRAGNVGSKHHLSEKQSYVHVTPSNFYIRKENEVITEFGSFDLPTHMRYNTKNGRNINIRLLEKLPQINSKDILDIVPSFVEAFNDVPYEYLFTDNCPQIVVEIGDYLQKNSHSNICLSLCMYWPPVVSKYSDNVEPFIVLCLILLNSVNDPIKFLEFIKRKIFPKITSDTCFKNSQIIAQSMCRIDGKQSFHWAVLSRNQSFSMYEIAKNECKEKIKEFISKILVEKEQKVINVIGHNGKKLVSFRPTDDDHVLCWNDYDKNIPYLLYLSTSASEFPEIFYKSIYEALVSSDFLVIKAFMKSDILSIETWVSICRMFIHVGKLHNLCTAVFLYQFEIKSVFDTSFWERDSHLKLFLKAIGMIYFRKFYENFFQRIVAKLDTQVIFDPDDLASVNRRNLEALVFSTLKNILLCEYYIPEEWKFVANILRECIKVKYNSVSKLVLALSGFFGRCIITESLADMDFFMPGIPLNKKKSLIYIANILKVPFSLNIYQKDNSICVSWNKRLEKHFFPRYYEFLISISDFDNIGFEASTGVSQIDEKKYLAHSVKIVIQNILGEKMSQSYKDVVTESVSNNSLTATVSGIRLAIFLSNFFYHIYDPVKNVYKRKKLRTKIDPVSLPHLPMFPGSESKSKHRMGALVGAQFNSSSKPKDEISLVEMNNNAADAYNIKEASENFYVPFIPVTPMKVPEAPPCTIYNPISANPDMKAGEFMYYDTDGFSMATDPHQTKIHAKIGSPSKIKDFNARNYNIKPIPGVNFLTIDDHGTQDARKDVPSQIENTLEKSGTTNQFTKSLILPYRKVSPPNKSLWKKPNIPIPLHAELQTESSTIDEQLENFLKSDDASTSDEKHYHRVRKNMEIIPIDYDQTNTNKKIKKMYKLVDIKKDTN